MQFVRSGDATLHVEASLPPDRPVVVFVNSLGSDLRIWNGVVERLADAGVGALRYDFRGHGLSDLGTPPRVIDDHVDDLARLMDHFKIGKATICGISVGGMIALGLSRRRPEKVGGLVLCCTGAKIGNWDFWNARIATVEHGHVGDIAEPILQRWFSPATYREGGGVVALGRNMLSRTSPAGYVATCVALRDSDMTEAARAVAVPTLCVAGENDGSTPPDLVRALRRLIPGARYEEIASAGHLPCLDHPAELAKLLLTFLGGPVAPKIESAHARGMAVRRRVLGDAHVDAAEANKTSLDTDFQRFITEGAWGSVWARPNLTLRERSMITLALLAALGHESELAMHTRATRRTGATPDDIQEVLLHVAVYGGVPAANAAFRTVKETLERMKETP
jgi:3-oxoadipate enol-lactonase/4-carboxymuconolactone decarboxylase